MNCPICNNNTFSNSRMNLIQCIECKAIMNPKFWKEYTDTEIQLEWFDAKYEIDDSFWIRQFEKLKNRTTYKTIKEFLHVNSTILEIGVGSGSLMKYLFDKGYSIEGLDLSTAICKAVSEKYNVKVHCQLLSNMSEEKKYDLIIMNHVLEHDSNPKQFLADVKKHLNKGGRIRIAVPNIGSWDAKLPGWNSYEPYHVVYYTPKLLKRLVSLLNFSEIKIFTLESFSGWFLAFLRTILKTYKSESQKRINSKSSKSKSPILHLYRLLMVISGIISFPFRYLQAKLGFGDEINCVALKDD